MPVAFHVRHAAKPDVFVSNRPGNSHRMKLSYLYRGPPGHPLHPPLTDVVIGAYTFALIAAVFDVARWSERSAAHAWWLALVVGLAFTIPAALTGLVDWLQITRGSELWKTATAHMLAMVGASILFLVTALVGHDDWQAASIGTAPFVLTVCGFAVLTVGGWLGGSIVFGHGMRVLGLADEPATEVASPLPSPEEEKAEVG
jgi:uncharacterized membrane protein